MGKVCDHWHKQEHIHYYEGTGDTELDSGAESEYEYTLKHRMLVCVHCMFIDTTVLKRVVFIVFPSTGTEIVGTYNIQKDAMDKADIVRGYWLEAEVAGSF